MNLFHFTAGEYLRGIAQHGLTVGDVPTDFSTLAGTVGVWFTTSDKAAGHGLGGSALEKNRFRLAVDVPTDTNLVRWSEWAAKNATLQVRQGLRKAGGQMDDSWFVYFGRVDPSRILEVTDMLDGCTMPDWQTVWPAADSLPGVRYEGRWVWQKRLVRDIREALKKRAGKFR